MKAMTKLTLMLLKDEKASRENIRPFKNELKAEILQEMESEARQYMECEEIFLMRHIFNIFDLITIYDAITEFFDEDDKPGADYHTY